MSMRLTPKLYVQSVTIQLCNGEAGVNEGLSQERGGGDALKLSNAHLSCFLSDLQMRGMQAL